MQMECPIDGLVMVDATVVQDPSNLKKKTITGNCSVCGLPLKRMDLDMSKKV